MTLTSVNSVSQFFSNHSFCPQFLSTRERYSIMYKFARHLNSIYMYYFYVICSTELDLSELDYSNYSKYFANLLYLEESQMRVDIGHYTMEAAPMRKDARTGLIRLMVGIYY